MQHKHFLITVLFVFSFCTLAAAQTRRIEAKKKGQESNGFDGIGSGMTNPEVVFNIGRSDMSEVMCYSPDGAYIANKSSGVIMIWEVETGRLLKTLTEYPVDLRGLSFSPDGKYLAIASSSTIRIWEVKTGKCIKTLTGYTDSILTLIYSPDGKYLVSAHLDAIIKIWEVKTGECIKTLTGHTDYIEAVAYSSDGKYVASASYDDTVKLWEVATGECIKTLTVHEDVGRPFYVGFAPDNKYIASGYSNVIIKIWDIETGKCIKTLSDYTLDVDTSKVYSVVYSPDWKYIASATMHETKLWEVASGNCIKILEGGYNIAYSPDGAYLAIDCPGIEIWEVESGELVKKLGYRASSVSSVSFAPNGKFVASGSLNETIRLWEVETGKCIKTLSERTGSVASVCYSPDGKYLASGSWDETIKLWEVTTGNCIKTLTGHTGWVESVCYSPDGKYLASDSWDGTIKIWNVATGECINTLTGHTSQVESVCYSPDGKYLASGSGAEKIKIWNVATGECIKTLEGHTGGIESIVYSPNGKYLASGSWGGTIKTWNVATGECINTLTGHTGWVRSVCYSPDGAYLASGSNDDTIRFWNASTGELLATTFNLEDDEWLTYTPEGFFAGSEWATKNLVHIVDGMKTIGMDQMYDSLYRPDLVSAKLSGEDISPYAQKVNFASLVQTGSAPVVTFLSLEDEVKERDVTIEFAIQNTGGGIGEVNLLLNGKNIRLAEKAPSKSGETVHFSHTITLQNGKNTVELYAKNAAGKVESLRVNKTLKWQGAVKKPDLYIFTVAINQYRDRELRLKYAVPDAEFILKGFSSQKKSLYQNIFTYHLFDGDVTKNGLKSSFEKLSDQVQADDVFVFYLAGHGVTYDEDGDYYYLPSDFRYRNSQDIQKQGISKNDLTRFLSLIKAGKTLVLMDTCSAGAFLGMNTRGGVSDKKVIDQVIDRLTRATGHATIVASSNNQVAMEGYEGHGIFTYILVEGLSGKADTDGDGFITLQELSAYTDREVPSRSFEKWGYEQVPQRVLFKQDFPIYTSGTR